MCGRFEGESRICMLAIRVAIGRRETRVISDIRRFGTAAFTNFLVQLRSLSDFADRPLDEDAATECLDTDEDELTIGT